MAEPNFSFDEGNVPRAKSTYQKKAGLGSALVRYSGGLIKEERTANYLLLFFAAICFMFIAISIFSGSEEKKLSESDIEEIIRNQKNANPSRR